MSHGPAGRPAGCPQIAPVRHNKPVSLHLSHAMALLAARVQACGTNQGNQSLTDGAPLTPTVYQSISYHSIRAEMHAAAAAPPKSRPRKFGRAPYWCPRFTSVACRHAP
jgi:hypothetical protein